VSVAVHLIVGPAPEPFLAAACDALADACDVLLVNDNSAEPSPHAAVLAESAFGREGRLVVDRTPFTDFAAARNVCLRLHARRDAGEWVLRLDADEIHAPQIARVTKNLSRVPANVNILDVYLRHFVQTFDWYMSITRHRCLFRFSEVLHWEGKVHEQLLGLGRGRLALPYLFVHYGWVLPADRHAQKARHYVDLGAANPTVAPSDDGRLRHDSYPLFRERWRRALHFSGEHPAAAQQIVSEVKRKRAAEFSEVDRLIRAEQTPIDRAVNALLAVNYEVRWRGRAFNPLASKLLV
jgi:hypothetical protein